MPLLKRMTNMMTANLHELLDWCERPDAMLKQVIREMDEELLRLRQRAVEAIAIEKQLTRRMVQIDQNVEQLRSFARQQLAVGQTTEARTTVRQLLQLQRSSKGLSSQQNEAQAVGQRLKQRISQLQFQRAEARDRLAILLLQSRVVRTVHEGLSSLTFPDWTAQSERWAGALELESFRDQARAELEADDVGTALVDQDGAEVEATLAALQEELNHGVQ